MTVLAVWSVSAVVSLPGLAISPILGDLNKVFPHATDLEIQMLTSLPSVLIIPFMLLAGRLSVTGNKFKLLVVGLTVFFLSGFACLFINQMWLLILVSCLTGIGAGIIIPLSTGYIVDYFTGDYRVRQLGYSSSINNLTLVLGVGELPGQCRLAPALPGIYVAGDSADPFNLHPPNSRRPGTCRER